MTANRRLPMDFYPPVGEQATIQLMHSNQGNPVAPDHTLKRGSYPDRRVRSMVFPTNRPMWTTLLVNGGRRILTTYKTPKGTVFTSPSSSVPQSQDQFMLSRRIYMYGGKVVTE